MRTKLIAWGDILALKFDENFFFICILGLSPFWGYKTNDKYFGEKITNMKKTDKINLKYDVIDGSVVNGKRQPILFCF